MWSIWTGASWSADELPVWDEVRGIHVDWRWTDHQRTFTQTLSISKENRPCSRVWKFVCMAGFCWLWLLASCLINAQPLPAHRPAADDNSLIGCTRPRPDRWLVASHVPISLTASTHFGARLVRSFLEPDVLKTMYCSTIPLRFFWSICSGNWG